MRPRASRARATRAECASIDLAASVGERCAQAACRVGTKHALWRRSDAVGLGYNRGLRGGGSSAARLGSARAERRCVAGAGRGAAAARVDLWTVDAACWRRVQAECPRRGALGPRGDFCDEVLKGAPRRAPLVHDPTPRPIKATNKDAKALTG
ncbi:hypothetical protein M885DRAFT_521920 [Pelagophyceae sp. CCMP2097]|nr:hypothetical protein M885DRAFT_521920 [Pelagophyceae sp. CCMP2097]